MATQSHAGNFSTKLLKNERSMPKWVTEANDRIGPKPPTPPGNQHENHFKAPALPPKVRNQPEPDYEVIEFCGQQYSNEPMKTTTTMRPKTPDTKLKCTLCGSNNPWVTCSECSQQIFCASCDDMFHKHPKRKDHVRKAIEQTRPPIPPKTMPGQPGPAPPVAPPRRSKRGFPTPLMQRKDQVNMQDIPPIPASPTPSMKHSAWHERVGSLKRGLNLMNRPLPDTPQTPTPSEGASSRSTTPKSVFDSIQRPPSVTLEKIKNKASATLDRMALLQQRYRQHKEEKERNRNGSVTEQNLSFDQWSNISPSPSHFRSGSMSSGLNSSNFDLTDDSRFNLLFNQRQAQLQQQQQQQQTQQQRTGNLGTRGMSSSVFNLSHINRRPLEATNNAWQNNQINQAQSMAQLNCASCHNQSNWNLQQHQHMHCHPNDWDQQFNAQQQLNRSNLSLNVGAGYMLPQGGMYPPPVFMTQRGMVPNMYPYPYPGGMPVMSPGLVGMPPATRSRVTSRAGSRAASPAMSRKSVTLRRKRTNYADDELTDDEDSEDDRRSMVSNRSGLASAPRPRQRRLSSASQMIGDDESETNSRTLRTKMRDQRRGSVAKSLHNDWVPDRRASANNGRVNDQPNFGSPLKPSRIYSDLDSESSGTRALVQAKIQEKLDEGSKKQKQIKNTAEMESAKKKPEKISTEVQAGSIKNIKSETTTTTAATKFNVKTKESEREAEKEITSEEEEEVEEEEEEEEATVPKQEPQQKDMANEIEENDEAPASDEEESSLLGPPPSTPDYAWECEFCTFVNEPNIKICSICCKTPSTTPAKFEAKAVAQTMKETKTTKTSNEIKPKVTNATKTSTTNTTKTTVASSSMKHLTRSNSLKTKTLTNGVAKMKVTSSENESDNSLVAKKKGRNKKITFLEGTKVN